MKLLLYMLLLFYSYSSCAVEWTGSALVESRNFFTDGIFPGQKQNTYSFAGRPEVFHSWNNDRDVINFKGFYRFDSNNDDRTHGDIRELSYIKALNEWEFRLGIRKVFWGVTESAHLVDIINQTDFVEGFDGEDKLGQPMINIALFKDFGTFNFFLMPFFRERTHPGKTDRFRFLFHVDDNNARYSFGEKNHHLDWALRWSNTIGQWDVGVYHFFGTNREPRYVAALTSAGEIHLYPHYDLIHQTATDIQYTTGGWLLKLEAFYRDWRPEDYISFATGFEYTFNSILKTNYDLGFITEYIYDSRNPESNTLAKRPTTPFENDIFWGARLALNDVSDTQVLLGFITDVDNSAKILSLEASRRLTNNWQLNIESRQFYSIPSNDFIVGFKKDSYIEVEAEYFF